MKRQVLVICTGNVCRSPMAAALMAARAEREGEADRYEFSSAGTWALDGEPASEHARTVLASRGLSLDQHRGRTVNRELIDHADLVLCMTLHHRDSLRAEFPHARDKIRLFSDLAGQQYDIGDPYGGTFQDYAACADSLTRLIEKGYPLLKEWLS